MVETVTQYLSAGMNVAFGGFVCWGFRYAQVEAVFRTPADPSLFASNFTGAIMSGLAGLYTTFQITAIQLDSVMYPIVLNAVLTVKHHHRTLLNLLQQYMLKQQQQLSQFLIQSY